MKKQWINTLIWTGFIVGAFGIMLLTLYTIFFKTTVFLVSFAIFIVISIAYAVAKENPIYGVEKKNY